MENNIEQKIDFIVQYISQSVSLDRRLEKKKISLQTAKLAFNQIDTKRKGYWDLANVYELCGQITENQLFHVFKWLDASKSGDITFADIQKVLVNKEKQQESKNSPLQQIKQIIIAFIQNIQYLEGLRKKFNFSQNLLFSVYKWICQISNTQYLTLQDLIKTFSQNKKWDDWCTQELKRKFKYCRNINQKTLYDVFLGGSSKNQQFTCKTQQKDQEQLLDGIWDSSVQKSLYMKKQEEKQKSSPRFNKIDQLNVYQRKSKHQEKNFSTFAPKKSQVSASFNSSQSNKQFVRTNNNTFTFMEIKQDNSEVDTVLSNIEKRREQLRRGSMQRKKLIQQTLQRKKDNTEKKQPIQNFYNSQSNGWRSNLNQSFKNFVRQDQSQITKLSKQQSRQILRQQTLNKSKSSYFQFPKERSSFISGPSKKLQSQFYEKNNFCCQNFIQNDRHYLTKENFSFKNKYNEQNYPKEESQIWNQNQNKKNFQISKMVNQTKKERMFERPSSSHFCQHKQKSSDFVRDPNIEKIIQKYSKQIGANSSMTNKYMPNNNQSEEIDRQKIDRYNRGLYNTDINIVNYSNYNTSNSPFFQKAYDRLTVQRQAPQTYLREQQKGKIYRSIDHRSRSNSIQKQNILKKAQEEATRKIQQIQRRAKMKVLQRKSSAGFKWVK